MKRIVNALIVLSVILLAVTATATTPQSIEVTRNLTSMPLAFTENQGQWDEQVQFRANAGGATMWFASDGAYYQFTRTIESDPISIVDKRYGMPDYMRDRQPDSVETMMIKANFVGANANPQMIGINEIDYKCNYFIGNDPNEWHTDVPNYQAIVYEDIYSGIDLKYYGNGKLMEYDFIVTPSADYSQIEIQYESAESISVNDDGQLVVETDWGEVIEKRPVIYQVDNGTRVAVAGEYTLTGPKSFGFELSTYDPILPLVIDPVLTYSTYLGGSSADQGWGIAVDASEAAYVTGITYSSDFPTENPYQADLAGEEDVFVTKLSSSGNSLIYSTYFGGNRRDQGFGIAVDASGAVYVTGTTNSTDFPTEGEYQTDQGGLDAFVMKLSSSGSSLVYSTYLGGSDTEYGRSIAVDESGAAYVTGFTGSTDFPTQNPFQTDQGSGDIFVTKLSSDGSSLIYSTYLGGAGNELGLGIAVDASTAAYVTGYTGSSDFPTEGAYQTVYGGGGNDAFITKLSSSGSSLIYSTYLGGSGYEESNDIAVDNSGVAYVTGLTSSSDFPIENPYQTYQGGYDVFVTKLSSSGSSLIYSTYLGGSLGEQGWEIATDASGAAYVTGLTYSSDFPTENPYQTDQGIEDVFVTKLSSSGSSLIYSTYLGGDNSDVGFAIAVDASGAAYVTGSTNSTNFPTEGAYQTVHSAGTDAFVTKLTVFIDTDEDGIVDPDDNCPNAYNPGQEDGDTDGVGDVCDNCPDVDNPGQTDDDSDTYGAACDCNDGDPNTYPGATEIPDDQVDQDCDGVDAITCIVDADQDGFGTMAGTTVIAYDGVCNTAQGESDNMYDCDDNDPNTYPGATEIPDDQVDQDCDGVDAITCIVDADQDGYGNDGGTTVIAPDGSCDTEDGESDNMTDCYDGDANINPGATEIPDDQVDQDCNGFDAITCFIDADQDGYGNDGGTTVIAPDGSCDTEDGESDNMTDCYDGDANINPAAIELCDGLDNDCSGDLMPSEEDVDADGLVECSIDAGGWVGDPAVSGGDDNCPDDYNPGQEDADGDLTGDACDPICCAVRGDVNHSGPGIDISDLVYLVDYMFNSGPEPPCLDEADINASGGIDISDLVYLVDYMFNGGPAPVACP